MLAALLLLLSAKRKSRKLVAERGSKVVEVQNKKVTQLLRKLTFTKTAKNYTTTLCQKIAKNVSSSNFLGSS